MYRNVWSRPETAEYMAWTVTVDEKSARKRMQRTIIWQENHDTWLVYEKNSRQAIGFAGVEKIRPYIYHVTCPVGLFTSIRNRKRSSVVGSLRFRKPANMRKRNLPKGTEAYETQRLL